jgi:hypothetical protein
MAYALFAGADYYPAGGMDDLIGVFESLIAAKSGFAQGYDEAPGCDFDWGQIVDTATFEKVLVWAVVVEGKRATKTRPPQLEVYDWVAPAAPAP